MRVTDVVLEGHDAVLISVIQGAWITGFVNSRLNRYDSFNMTYNFLFIYLGDPAAGTFVSIVTMHSTPTRSSIVEARHTFISILKHE